MDELRADFGIRAGALEMDVAFRLSAPWTCLFGASGSGKTTILRVISGLARPQRGRIALGEWIWCDVESGIWVPPHRRAVRCAMQQAWLFPGTVRYNVGYAGTVREHKGQVDEVLERFDLKRLAEIDVRRLSGGERQRVSVARAVTAAVFGEVPVGLLLLDEPLAGMDMALRDQFALELRSWLRERAVTVLSVTHDVGEAFLLGAEIIRIVDGRVVSQGPVEEVLAEERLRLRAVLQ